MYRLVRPLLFLLAPETAHALAAGVLRLRRAPKAVPGANPALRQTLWGIDFPTPLGLAAGMDKGQVLAGAWFRMGFGWVEIGTVTPQPQPGNERPRLFRMVPDRAVINRMGFNNEGADAVAERLRNLPR
ncbi:MAG: dihydroorotate dehydrogenase (quinone), partial [Deltaproteobacteria bacterium]